MVKLQLFSRSNFQKVMAVSLSYCLHHLYYTSIVLTLFGELYNGHHTVGACTVYQLPVKASMLIFMVYGYSDQYKTAKKWQFVYRCHYGSKAKEQIVVVAQLLLSSFKNLSTDTREAHVYHHLLLLWNKPVANFRENLLETLHNLGLLQGPDLPSSHHGPGERTQEVGHKDAFLTCCTMSAPWIINCKVEKIIGFSHLAVTDIYTTQCFHNASARQTFCNVC